MRVVGVLSLVQHLSLCAKKLAVVFIFFFGIGGGEQSSPVFSCRVASYTRRHVNAFVFTVHGSAKLPRVPHFFSKNAITWAGGGAVTPMLYAGRD